MSVAIDASSNNIIRQNVMGGRSSIIDQGSCCNEIIENWIGVTREGRSLDRQAILDSGIVVHQPFNRIAGNTFGGITYSAVRALGLGEQVSDTVIGRNTLLPRQAAGGGGWGHA